ncbi:MAG: ABC transporter permease [Dokdonella sp.]
MRIVKSILVGLGMLLLVALSIAAWVMLPWPLLGVLVMLLVGWMAVTRTGRQAASVTWVGVSTIGQRLGASSVIVVGIAGVVGVLVALLSMGDGLQRTLQQTGDTATAIILRGGASAELSSGISRADATLIAQLPGIAKDDQGRPIVSAEVVVVANLLKKSTNSEANAEIRGIGPEAWALRPQIHIIEGRTFTPGLREMVVGKGARNQFVGLEPNASIALNNQQWTIVGVFESGDAHESELLGDAGTVASAYRRDGFQSVSVRLNSAAALDELKAAVASDPRLKVDAKTTLDYYTAQSEQMSKIIRIIGITIAVIMAIGAVFGALNTMYAAIAARAREIATLRAIGFGGAPVVVSVMMETMLLALLGGVLGAGIAWLVFDNYTVSTLGANFSQVVFQFTVSPTLLGNGIKWALAIGFVGGLFPALRAASLPVTTALRES